MSSLHCVIIICEYAEIHFKKFIPYKENMAMKFKRLFQVLIVFVLILSSAGGSQSASASTTASVQAEAMIIDRNLNIWDATYVGFVNASIHEKWHFDFTETHTFVVAVSAISGDLVPLLILRDTNGNEITRGTSTVTSTQPAGNYSIQVQPESGSGFYVLTLREVLQVNPNVVTTVTPGSVTVGQVAVATVTLNNVPAGGYSSAEFTCTYNGSLVDIGTPVATTLFGADPVTALHDLSSSSFIFAIAGSNGSKATTSGAVFSFSVTGLSAGTSPLECDARVSTGNNTLTDITSTGTTITVTGTGPTATFTPVQSSATPTSSTPVASPTATSLTPVASPTATSLTPAASPTATSLTPVASPTATSLTPVNTATATSSTPVNTATATSTTPGATATSTLPAQTATPSFTPVSSPTFTSTPLPDGTVNGDVNATKPVTVSLLDATDTVIRSVTANLDGTFSLSAPAGTYTLRATASGFLSAEGPVTITSGNTTTQPTIALLAGDINGNNVIDQFDALTIGMGYNTAIPAAADLNNDGVINVLDLEMLAQNYRETGPTVWE